MGQLITKILDLKKAVLEHEEMSIEVFLETMMDEGLIDAKTVNNPNVIDKDGNVYLDIDKSNSKNIRVVCPFHHTDHNGSGRLNLDEQYYKCFNGDCIGNKPMNAIDLYMVFKLGVEPNLLSTEDVTKTEFPKAVREIADMLGIPYEIGERSLTSEQKEAAIILEIREEFAGIYHEALFKHKYAPNAMKYMVQERGFEYGVVPFEELVTRYKMGFAPGWSYGYDRTKHKYSDEILIKAGVVRRVTDKQNKPVIRDFLSGGVVLPYYSKEKINNLYARNLFAKDHGYRHLRLKGNVDIPINFDVAKKFKELIFVEGEFSWLSMVALEYENTIGNRGTNGLSDEHIAAIKSIRDKTDGAKCSVIYLCFDPDDAGQGAIAKTGKKLLDEGFDVRVIRLKNGDPNDFLQTHRNAAKKEMDRLIQEAISYEAFMISYWLAKANLTTTSSNADVLAALKKVQPFVDKTPKLQLAVIADEVVKYLHSAVITLPVLYKLWLDIELPHETKEERKGNIGLQEAAKYFWVFTTDSKERYDVLQENGSFKNVVLVQNARDFIQEIQQFTHVNSILFDAEMKNETTDLFFSELKNFKFKKFECDSTEEILTSNTSELFSMVKEYSLSSSNIQ